MGFGSGASACQQTGSRVDTESAAAHEVVTLRLEGLLESLVQARAHMLRGEVAAKGAAMARCVAVIGDLRGSRDGSIEPTISERLDALYDYMGRRLLQANLRDDATIIDEVSKLLQQVHDSWAQIAPAAASHAVEG